MRCIVVSVFELAEDAGFEPAIGFPIHAFQACALGHYANPPRGSIRGFAARPPIPVSRPQFAPDCGATREAHPDTSLREAHLETEPDTQCERPPLCFPQIPRAASPRGTPPGPEGSKGTHALSGARGILYERCLCSPSTGNTGRRALPTSLGKSTSPFRSRTH
jgi:hypothetical protein